MAYGKVLGKLRGKVPPPKRKDDEHDDPMFEMPDTEPDAGDGDVENESSNVSPDADADEKTQDKGEHADYADMGSATEGDELEEMHESEDERAAEMSDEAIMKEYHKRGLHAKAGGSKQRGDGGGKGVDDDAGPEHPAPIIGSY